MDITSCKRVIDRELTVWLKERRAGLGSLVAATRFALALGQLEAIAAGGKRLRPYMASLGCRMGGKDMSPEWWDACVALEAFHVFCLIHDDIMDRGEKRHGVPTMQVWFRTRFEAESRMGDLAAIADAEAMLVGDLLFGWVTRAVAEWPVRFGESGKRASAECFRMVDEVVIGQMMDVELTTMSAASDADIEEKMYLKTASYSFTRPLSVGAALAGVLDAHKDTIERFGRALGIAFQIQDDLLDIIGTEAVVGKTLMQDTKERQQTVFTKAVFESGHAASIEAIRRVRQGDADVSDAMIRAAYEESGALVAGRRRMDELFAEARVACREMPESVRGELLALVELIAHRSA